MVFSHSRLSSYENCPRQYQYRYIDKLEMPVEGVEAFVGKRVHEVLERLYHHVRTHGRPPTLAQVISRFRRDWAFHWHADIRIVREENDAAFYQEHGVRCLENYYRANYPFDFGETIGVEQPVTLVLDEGGRYQMRGVIDRLVRTREGRFEVHDYKTSASLPPRWRLERDRQLPVYQIAVQQAHADAQEVDLVWHFLAFNRTVRSSRTAEQLDELREATIRCIDEIEAASDFPTRTGPLCRWCDYRDLCPAGSAHTGIQPEPEGEPAPPQPPVSRGQLSLL